jgi:hypothetical protein
MLERAPQRQLHVIETRPARKAGAEGSAENRLGLVLRKIDRRREIKHHARQIGCLSQFTALE